MTPLKQKWVVWEHRQKHPDDKGWMDQFCQVAPLETAEAFWQFFTHYPKPSTLFRGVAEGFLPPAIKRGFRTSRVLGILMMKDPVPPETKAKREDGSPWTGERYLMDARMTFDELPLWDTAFETMLLGCIGETVSSDAINGVWLANRTKEPTAFHLRIEVWCDAKASREEIDEAIKTLEDVVVHHSDVKLSFSMK